MSLSEDGGRALEGSSRRRGNARSIEWSLRDEPVRTALASAASASVAAIHSPAAETKDISLRSPRETVFITNAA